MEAVDQVAVLLEYNKLLQDEHAELSKIEKVGDEVDLANYNAHEKLTAQNAQLRRTIEIMEGKVNEREQ